MAKTLRHLFMLGVPLLSLAVLGGSLASALPYGVGTYNSCTYNICGISLSTGTSVNLASTPTASGANSTAKDDVVVSTDASTGYTLTFTDSDTNTALSSGGDSLTASASTPASPATLAMNTWGYRVDGLAGFGAGPTSAQNSDASATYTFAGVPASDQTSHTLKTTSSAASPSDTTSIWYGVRIDTTKTSGSYSGQITYTAVTNN